MIAEIPGECPASQVIPHQTHWCMQPDIARRCSNGRTLEIVFFCWMQVRCQNGLTLRTVMIPHQPFCITQVEQFIGINKEGKDATGQPSLTGGRSVGKKAVEPVALPVVAIKALFGTYPQITVGVLYYTEDIDTPNGARQHTASFPKGGPVRSKMVPVVAIEPVLRTEPQKAPAIFQHVIDRSLGQAVAHANVIDPKRGSGTRPRCLRPSSLMQMDTDDEVDTNAEQSSHR